MSYLRNGKYRELSRIRDFYNNKYYSEYSLSSKPNRHAVSLIKKLTESENIRILDIGCGSGEFLFAAESIGIQELYGIDISNKIINEVKNTHPTFHLKVGCAEDLPWDDNQFDLVACLGALEHFVDKRKAITEMMRVANDNAQILLLVPNKGFLTRRLGLFQGTQQNEIMETVLHHRKWKEYFEEHGLNIKKIWRDLHIVSKDWILKGPFYLWPIRFIQAISLCIWPISWQYQIYYLCEIKQQNK